MDIELARTFLAVVETGSFFNAAGKVNVTQSTVSMRIRTLEQQLGQPVFERSKTGATMTAAGRNFQ
jgi:DNA-binding transcriptional LysR family regulator